LFERASFGTALLHVAPLTGAYLAVRLVMPIAPDWVLRGIGWVSLVTAIYAGGMALVQRDGRRFFCFLFLSHSALVLVGLEAVTPIGLTGALCVWLTVGMSLGGLGLTLRALEARRGRLSLTSLQGMYDHTPDLAVSFLLTGLASVGFPGMAGFVGAELLVDGVVEAYPLVGVTVVIAAALAGIAIVKAYFFLFTGPCHQSSIPLHSRPRLRWSMLILVALVLLGGVFPQPGVKSRFEAATELLHLRAERGLRTLPDPTDENEHDSGSHAPPFVAG
ncbi:MAG: proton-conducting transporter membrane subunit, partial [Planctomycetota bacterium]